MLKIGVQSRGVINEDVLELGYKRINEAGMTSVDYNIIWSDINKEESLDIFFEHKKMADKYNIEFSQVHSPRYSPITMPEDMDSIIKQFKRSMEVCEILKAPFLVVHPLQLEKIVGTIKEREYNISYLSNLANISADYNVTICLENLFNRYGGRIIEGFCSSSKDIIKVIEEVNNISKKNIGSCFDIGHTNALRKNIKNEVLTLGNHLKCLHIHDNDGDGDNHQIPYTFGYTATGSPTTDWSGFLLALREIDYKGAISFEPYKALINTPGILQQSMLTYLYEIGKHFSYVIRFKDILKNKTNNKKIILFGAGKMLDVYMDLFGDDYNPEFIVDNNKALWGSERYNIPIKNPTDISIIEDENRCIIICSGYFEHITLQLNRMGILNFIYSEEVYRLNGKPL